MPPLYPLQFTPIFRRAIWGGRNLANRLGKQLPPGDDYGESWEVVDHGADQSVVAAGALAGTTLGELVRTRGEELLGRHHPRSQFPLLFKFLDCRQDLSVQVHPDDAAASRLDPPDAGKTEAWVILAAEPGAKVYAGLKRGFDRPAFERELNRGTAELCLHPQEVHPGDCLFIPAGTIHALGAGLLAAEIQQASDTTYRLFDWNRLGPDGRPRKLHIEEGLAVSDFQTGPVRPATPVPGTKSGTETLVACDKFVLERIRTRGETQLGGDGRFHILALLSGAATLEHSALEHSSGPLPLAVGSVVLLPACTEAALRPSEECVFLDMYLP